MKRIIAGALCGFVFAFFGGGSRADDEPAAALRMAVEPAPKSIVFDVAFSPDSKQIALACEDKAVRIYDWPSGKQRMALEGHVERVWTAAFSPDGKWLASCTGEYRRPTDPGELKIWDLASGQVKATLAGHQGLIFHVVFSPDGKTLLSTGWDGTVRLWDVATGQLQTTLTDHKGPVRTLVFARDGKMFATASFDGTVRLWDAATAKLLKTLNAHENGVQRVLFSPDGKHMATASRLGGESPGEVKVWYVASGEEVASLTGPKGWVLSIDFSSDGAMLALGGGRQDQYGEVKLIEVASGRSRAKFDGHKEWVECVRFTPDGKTLVSAGGFTRGQPGEVRAWPLASLRQTNKNERLSADQVRKLWDELASDDAALAYRALLDLSAAPADALPLLKERLRPAVAADSKQVVRLIAKLDSDSFAEREEASQELKTIADVAQLDLQKAHDEAKSLEVKQRLRILLRDASFTITAPESLRVARAVEILEATATPEARQLLEMLTTGAPTARLSEQSRAALERIKRCARQ